MMTRKEFVRMCGLLGVSIPLSSNLASCSSDDDPELVPFEGKITVIGAGAGGLATGYLLNQIGVNFEILEASSVYGGRMRINTDFADFPIPLGSEWLETDRGVFDRIVNDPTVNVDIETVKDGKHDRKFVNYSWFNFFEDHIVPSISSKIRYNTPVQTVDYSEDQVIIATSTGEFSADKVILSVPLKILQDRDITFSPSLPEDKLSLIDSMPIWSGFEAFFEFSEKFYQEEFAFNIQPESDGQKAYYDATLGQDTTKNILGLFTVGLPAEDYTTKSGEALKQHILNELDSIYDNQASPNYVNHITQNWNDEPFIKAGYMSDYAKWREVKKLRRSVDNKLYFAGGPFTDGDDWVSVHAAAQSAKDVVAAINQ